MLTRQPIRVAPFLLGDASLGKNAMARVHRSKLAAIAAVVAAALVGAVVASLFWTKGPEMRDEFERREPPEAQPLEIRAWWAGIAAADTDAPTARRMSIPPETKGVVVVQVDEQVGWRAKRAGLQVGDVIVGVNGKSVSDVNDLRDVTAKMDAAQAIMLEVDRRGQRMTFVLPAVLPQQSQPPAVAPGAPNGFVQNGALPAGALPGAPAAEAPSFVCPFDGTAWPRQSVHPNYRCPRCNRQLVQQLK